MNHNMDVKKIRGLLKKAAAEAGLKDTDLHIWLSFNNLGSTAVILNETHNDVIEDIISVSHFILIMALTKIYTEKGLAHTKNTLNELIEKTLNELESDPAVTKH